MSEGSSSELFGSQGVETSSGPIYDAIGYEAEAQPKPQHARSFLKFNTCIGILAIAEGMSAVCAVVLAKLLYIDLFLGQTHQSLAPYLAPAPLLAFALYLFLKQMGLYENNALFEPVIGYGRILGALALSFLVLLGFLYIIKTVEFYSRGWLLTWFALSAVALIGVRIFFVRCTRTFVEGGLLRQRVALYGTSAFVTAIKQRVERESSSIAIGGVYLSTPAKDMTTGDLGGLPALEGAIARGEYDIILIGAPTTELATIRTAVKSLSSYSTELLLCTELEPYPVRIQGSRAVGGVRLNVIDLVPGSERNRVLKSALDYAVAAAGLLLLAPLLAVAALAIKLDSPGPVFFRQRRYGQNNRVFRIFKFRTMAVTEDGSAIRQAERNDPRVTRVGRFLRVTSIDELPQLFNVLAGEMSIVGPRPHAVAHDQNFEKQLDVFARRRRVRPGLTGWAQVNGLRGETRTVEQIRQRTEHDLYYIDNWSIWLDVEIIMRTLFVLGRGAY